jgi:hypothetical protein
MARLKLIVGAASLAAVCACMGPDDDMNWGASENGAASAEGQAEDGKISIKAPGLDMAIALPKELTGEAKTGHDSKVLYPASVIAGIAIAAAENGKGGDTDVEIRFRTSDAPDRVAAWYRDPARAEGFSLDGASRDGRTVVLTGVQKRDKHPFKVRLSPAAGGGTDGRLRVHHHD